MKYMGSKSRIAKDIVPIIQNAINNSNFCDYIEPFCGGCNIIDKIECKNKIAIDKNKYLIALLQHVKDNGSLYENIPRELYNKAREEYNSNEIKSFTNWQIGNIGFLSSYNGRFFDGGYAESGYETTKNGKRYRNYYNESKNNLIRQSKMLKDIQFYHNDYTNLKEKLYGFVIYCDPPYKNTKQYSNSSSFDYVTFWKIVREWSKTNIVIVSEMQAPVDFVCIWEKDVSRSIKSTDKSFSTEKLFVYKYGLYEEMILRKD